MAEVDELATPVAEDETPDPDWAPVHTREAFDALCEKGALGGEVFEDLDLTGVDLKGQDLERSQWVRCALRGADLTGCDLTASRFRACDLTGAKMVGATLDEASLTLDADGVINVLVAADLREASFEETDLLSADLSESDLREATFTRTNLCFARLVRADVREAHFDDVKATQCDAWGACFDDAWLEGVDFRGARLAGASFRRVDLDDIVLADANLTDTVFDYPEEEDDA